MRNALNPRSRVIPLCLDCDDLSRDAVDRSVESVFTSEVLPESTCPNTPTFRFRTLEGSIFFKSFAVIFGTGLSPSLDIVV